MKQDSLLRFIINVAISIILFFMIFMRGLFFQREIQPVIAIIFIAFFIWCGYKIYRKEKFELNSLLTVSVALLPIAYFLPFFLGQAVSKQGALDYIFRYLAAFALFLVASDLIKSRKEVVYYFRLFLIPGIISGILCVDAALGSRISYAFNLYGIGYGDQRVNGILQYGNTSGAYYAFIIFVIIGLILFAKSKLERAILSSFIVLMFLSLILTMSRGALLVFGVAYILLLVMLPEKEEKVRVIFFTVPAFILTALVIAVFEGQVQLIQQALAAEAELVKSPAVGFLMVFAGVLAQFGISYFMDDVQLKMLNKKSNPENTKKIMIASISALCIIAILFFATGVYKSVLPESVINRFTPQGTASERTSGRTDLYMDGMRAIGDYWLLGAGGGSWQSAYRIYQRFIYDSTEPHNILIQVFLDTGIFGILVLGFFFLACLWAGFRNRKHKNGLEIVMLAICAYMWIGHSIIDFDFSYMSVLIFVFLILGGIRGLSPTDKINIKLPYIVPLVLIALCFVTNVSFMIGRIYASSATRIINEQQQLQNEVTEEGVLAAISSLQKATKFAPFETNYYIIESITDADLQLDLKTLYLSILSNPDAAINVADELYEVANRAIQLDALNPEINFQAGQVYIALGNIQQGLELIEKSVQYNPMKALRYEALCEAYYEVGLNYEDLGETGLAIELYERVMRLEDEVILFNETKEGEPIQLTGNTYSILEAARNRLLAIAN